MREPTFDKVYNRKFIKSQAVTLNELEPGVYGTGIPEIKHKPSESFKDYLDILAQVRRMMDESIGIPKS